MQAASILLVQKLREYWHGGLESSEYTLHLRMRLVIWVITDIEWVPIDTTMQSRCHMGFWSKCDVDIFVLQEID